MNDFSSGPKDNYVAMVFRCIISCITMVYGTAVVEYEVKSSTLVVSPIQLWSRFTGVAQLDPSLLSVLLPSTSLLAHYTLASTLSTHEFVAGFTEAEPVTVYKALN
ncbi:uncharacterized protein BT62DRAFT_1074550 [Guyanagaster necrorhizus]|uniref:Uncharacterized protein n=1 Tax=Guyanagaster necrorhizus TaxID=856835 RepID=A0A9P7VWV3_9AGAR|nr:uncharacterized protein BT62DRAFT_1074550 [Guyanagaster necrorhizus MCA 3950]KAG7448032.1 hypothetical protein BT62DRAFT_1074550 [Guyanagaster necrorhizus MCA 3950]